MEPTKHGEAVAIGHFTIGDDEGRIGKETAVGIRAYTVEVCDSLSSARNGLNGELSSDAVQRPPYKKPIVAIIICN